MKMMIWNCAAYASKVTGISTRGVGDMKHDVHRDGAEANAVAVAFVTVEAGDVEKSLLDAAYEIAKASEDWGRSLVVVTPFAHLSNDLEEMSIAHGKLEELVKKIQQLNNSLTIQRDHFGSDKSLTIELIGHPGNVRFRSL